MALQGTLDTFALPDVLRLLATTKKTGCLRLNGGRGTGTVHVEDGELVAAGATHAPLAVEPVDALFELLRFEDGSFVFDADVAPDEPGPATAVETLLEGAGALLAEWREIESVVPSLDAYVTLRRRLEDDEVTIPGGQWETLVAVGSGSTVRALGDALELAELPISRAVRDLLALGVVDLEARAPEPALAPPPAVPVGADDDPATALEPQGDLAADEAQLTDEARSSDEALVADDGSHPGSADELPVARPIRARRPRPRLSEAADEPQHFVPLDLPGHHASPITAGALAEGEDGPMDDLTAAFPGLARRPAPIEVDDAEVARQLAALSPQTVDAVRAAAEAPTDEAREAALEEAVEGEDGPVNRGLLLKFLGSVKS